MVVDVATVEMQSEQLPTSNHRSHSDVLARAMSVHTVPTKVFKQSSREVRARNVHNVILRHFSHSAFVRDVEHLVDPLNLVSDLPPPSS